jgi:hypothetical protein
MGPMQYKSMTLKMEPDCIFLKAEYHLKRAELEEACLTIL